MAKPNPLVDATKPFVARLLHDLSNRALDTYEKKTGLNGVRETFAPMVGEVITHHVGDATFDAASMTLGGKIFDWLSSLSSQTVQQVIEQPVMQENVNPIPNMGRTSVSIKGAPIPGAFNPGYRGRRGRE